MLFQKICYLVLSIVSLTSSQSAIRIGIFDDTDQSKRSIQVKVPNVTLCGRQGLTLQLYWLNTSSSLFHLLKNLEAERDRTHVHLTRTVKRFTKLIRDFSQINSMPFINMKSYGSQAILCPTPISSNEEYFVTPNILGVVMNYLKNNYVKKAVYIYDNQESTNRIYELLQLMNSEEYFNHFSLNIRTTHDDDIYSLLYSIESYSFQKDPLPRYVLLDLQSYENYEKMFDKISHMGLTSDSYQYVIVSTFDACLWMNKLNFNGRLIYFDYQQRNCSVDDPRSSTINGSTLSSKTIFRYPSYYRSTLSFRTEQDSSKDSHSSQVSKTNTSLSSNDSNSSLPLNSCHKTMTTIDEYLSYASFSSQLSKTSRYSSRSLFDALNLVIRMLTSNLIDCKTYRFKPTKKKTNHCSLTDVNVFSTRKSASNQFRTQIQLIGRYSTIDNHYQSCHSDKPKSSSRFDESFSSRVYYVTSLFDEPFLMLRKRTSLQAQYSHPQADLKELRGRILGFHELEGFCVDLAAKVCSILNITCQFQIVEDGNFGSKNVSTGFWNGMVGEIVSRKADMAIAPLTISQKRMEVVDFSKPFMNLGISIMIGKPDAQKPGVFSFMHPVSMEIWLCFSLAYFAVSVVLFITSRVVNSGWRRRIVRRPSYRSFSYPKSVNDRRKSEIQLQRHRRDSTFSEQSSEPIAPTRTSTRRRYHYRTRPPLRQPSQMESKKDKKSKKNGGSEKNAVHLFGISNALFFSFASFMRQSINLVPKSLSGRIAAISWWYFSLIFISSYTANLVAFLTVEKLVTPIESVEDLAKQQEINYGSLRNGTTSAFFEKSNVSVFQQMWAVMQKRSSEVFVTTNDEGVAKVRNSKGKYAFFIESTKNEYVNERLPCDTMKVGSDLDSKGYGIATRLGSDLTEAINIIITNLRESGFLEKLKQRWWYERSECSQTTKDKRFSELSLSSVTGLFYIFLFGIILSCLIAFTEFLITAKSESEKLQIDFREMLRIKMIENLVGITISTQRQLENDRSDDDCNDQEHEEENEIIRQYTDYQLRKPQSDV